MAVAANDGSVYQSLEVFAGAAGAVAIAGATRRRRWAQLGVLATAVVASVAVWAHWSRAAGQRASLGGEDRLGPGGPSGYFLQLSDVHLDPWYEPELSRSCFCSAPSGASGPPEPAPGCAAGATGNSFGQVGCDSPLALLLAVLAAAAAAAPAGGYDWVLVAGDYSRHRISDLPEDTREKSVRDIIGKVVAAVDGYFHDTAVHHGFGHDEGFTLGNNDFGINYGVNVTDPQLGVNPWFASLVPLFDRRSRGQGASDEEANTFARGGYFMRRLSPDLYLLSLNTVVYSARHAEERWRGGAIPEDPFGQFAWMREQLAWLQRRPHTAKALIVGHIPPSLDHFHFEALWLQPFVTQYLEIVAAFAEVVAGQLYAHLHVSTFRLLPSARALDPPLFVAGAVSPVYQNRPSFRVWKYEGSSLLDYTESCGLLEGRPQRSLRFVKQKSALETFGLQSLGSGEWQTHVAAKLADDAGVWQRYVDALWLQDSGIAREEALNSSSFRAKTACAMQHWTEEAFTSCVKHSETEPIPVVT